METRPAAEDVVFYVDLELLVDTCDEMVLATHVREAWQATIDRHRL